MQSIELTQKHKDKLLEMCKALFCSDNTPYIENNNINVWNLAEGVEAEYSVSIHWFEFVFLHLVLALQNKMSDEQMWSEIPPYVGNVYNWEKGTKWTLYTKFMFHYPKAIWGGSGLPTNPIDYLYDEFKKLK